MRRHATTLGMQRWPWKGPRVLIEDPDSARGLATATVLRRAGYAVALCPGPSEFRDPPERCSLLDSEDCLIVEGADAVVFRLGLDRTEGRRVLSALRLRRPGTPLVVEVPGLEVDRYRAELGGCELVCSAASPEELVGAVDRAVAKRRPLGREAGFG